jgi:hypothetical protein
MQEQVSARALGAALAILVSYNSVLSLGFGLFGSQGNSTLTGLILVSLLATTLLLSVRYFDGLMPIDLVFAGLLVVALASIIVNRGPGDLKESLLLATTFAAYVVCRSISRDALDALLPVFKRTSAVIVAIGVVFTAAAMLSQSDADIGRPQVLGFDGAPAQILMTLSFLILGLVTSDHPTTRRTILISALIFLPVVIFAAAMVRFTFVALGVSMFLTMILAPSGKRWHVIAVALTIFVAVGVGLSARPNSARNYVGHLLEVGSKTRVVENAPAAQNCPPVNMRNSIDIRRLLVEEALHRIPNAGLLGHGLDSSMQSSCLGFPVHNSILQAAVEFGWLGGGIFVLLLGLSILTLLPAAWSDSAARFVLCGLVFALLISLAHGRISRDIVLFALLGCAAGVGRMQRPVMTETTLPALLLVVTILAALLHPEV